MKSYYTQNTIKKHFTNKTKIIIISTIFEINDLVFT